MPTSVTCSFFVDEKYAGVFYLSWRRFGWLPVWGNYVWSWSVHPNAGFFLWLEVIIPVSNLSQIVWYLISTHRTLWSNRETVFLNDWNFFQSAAPDCSWHCWGSFLSAASTSHRWAAFHRTPTNSKAKPFFIHTYHLHGFFNNTSVKTVCQYLIGRFGLYLLLNCESPIYTQVIPRYVTNRCFFHSLLFF